MYKDTRCHSPSVADLIPIEGKLYAEFNLLFTTNDTKTPDLPTLCNYEKKTSMQLCAIPNLHLV